MTRQWTYARFGRARTQQVPQVTTSARHGAPRPGGNPTEVRELRSTAESAKVGALVVLVEGGRFRLTKYHYANSTVGCPCIVN